VQGFGDGQYYTNLYNTIVYNTQLQNIGERNCESFFQGLDQLQRKMEIESDHQTLEEIASTIRRVRHRAIRQYFLDLSASADPSGIQKSSWSGEYSYLPINSDRH